jgi:rhodanese-related sulfurtransferase/membrane protein insertase Oxa1/YidC/SpoIIIJ/phosphohistidine swiveling domain-containing protein
VRNSHTSSSTAGGLVIKPFSLVMDQLYRVGNVVMESPLIRALKASSTFCYTAAASSLLFLASSAPSYAIPSPDLVVGSISSISQLVAIISAMIGGSAVVVGVRATSDPAVSNRTGRIAWRVVAVAAVLLGLSLAANYYQYSTQRSERQARLEAAIQRPTITSDGHTLDPNLKEPSYDEQLSSPRGISTADVERLVEEKKQGLHDDEVLLDVRENAEVSTGSMHGATAIRFPDLPHAHLNFAGKTAILFCDNGNRSYQTCQEMAAMGIDCRFMVGGLEKWFAEHRPLGDGKATSLADFRSLPPYTNKTVLLDTPDVHALVDEGAVFVDVRYPGEFAAYHLPAAIDLPIRPTVGDELRARIAALPHRPIIAPCYDRRSCFYAQILGYEVTQAGYDFRGRYTLPWDYFVPPPPRPYILEYLGKLHESWWAKLVDLVAVYVNKFANYAGFLTAIILLAAVSRLLVLPFSMKAERDQIISRNLAHRIEELKRRLESDPPRMARAMRAFYRQQGLTPLRNLIGLAFVPVMSVCVAAIHAVALKRDQPLLWIENSARSDPTYALPLIFSALICVYLDNTFVRTLRQRVLIWVIGMIVLTATGSFLSPAADCYLVISASLLLLQRLVVTSRFSIFAHWIRRWRLGDDIVSLDDPQRLSGCGNKAYRLGVMRSHGFAVPEGIVLTARFLEKFSTTSGRWRSRQLDRVWRNLGAKKVAVRSSGSAEDGGTNSFAGVFASVLHVDRASLEKAICDVLSSFGSAVAASYGADNAQANIIVQRMIEPEYSGVLFTRDPACTSHSLVELVEGTADALVSGAVAPVSCRIGRVSAQPPAGAAPPIDLSPLIAIGQRLEDLFDHPQDIEWAYLNGQFYFVQSRDITRMEQGTELNSAIQGEWSRVLDCAAGNAPDEIAFEQNELSEVLPRPTTLSLSLMESLWTSGGSIDLACRKLGLSYRVEETSPPYLITIFGNLYVNKHQEIVRAPQLSSLAIWRMNRISDKVRHDFSKVFLPEFLKEIAWQEAIDFDKLSNADLLEAVMRLRRDYVFSTSAATSVINIVADYYLKRAKEKLLKAGIEPARYLARLDQTEFERTIIAAHACPPELRRQALLQRIAHRSLIDYELAEPRYGERPSDLDQLLEMPISIRTSAEIRAALTAATDDLKLIDAALVACSFQTLKEDAKHYALRELAVLRRGILAVDRRFKLDGSIFQMTFDEIESLANDNMTTSLRSVARERRRRAAQIGQMVSVSSALTIRQLESYASGIKLEISDGSDELVGIRVSGSGVVVGRACVVMTDNVVAMASIPNFKDGDIVVSRMVPPAWIPYFQRAGGFVCEVGGWLSHTAIVAREFNVPLIVQVKGLQKVETGNLIRLHPDGAVEFVEPAATNVAAE